MERYEGYFPMTYFISCKDFFATDIQRLSSKKIPLFIEKAPSNKFRLWRHISPEEQDKEITFEKSGKKIKMSAWLGERLTEYKNLKEKNIVPLNRRKIKGE